LGAGPSFSSGVPLAGESVKRIARRYYAERIVGGKMLPEQVKTSEWMTWLGEQDWFVRDTARLPENFPLVIKHLLTPQAYRQKVLLDLIAPDRDIGSGYRHLAEQFNGKPGNGAKRMTFAILFNLRLQLRDMPLLLAPLFNVSMFLVGSCASGSSP
jgi:hypothetical protein